MLHDGGVGLAVGDGEAGTPFEVGDEGGAEAGIGGQSDVVGGVDHAGHPSPSLSLGEGEVAVLGEHVLVAAEFIGVGGRSAEGLGQPGGDVAGMLRIHPRNTGSRIGSGSDKMAS